MDFRFQRQKCFITGLKTTLQHCGEHPFRKIAFLGGDVSNLADSHPNVHLLIGGRHQLNLFFPNRISTQYVYSALLSKFDYCIV